MLNDDEIIKAALSPVIAELRGVIERSQMAPAACAYALSVPLVHALCRQAEERDGGQVLDDILSKIRKNVEIYREQGMLR